MTDRQNTHFGFKHRAGLPHICAHHSLSFILCKIVKENKGCQAFTHTHPTYADNLPVVLHTESYFQSPQNLPLSLPEGNLKCIVTTFTKQQALWGHSHELKWSFLLYCEWAAQVTAKQKTRPCDDLSRVLGHLLSHPVRVIQVHLLLLEVSGRKQLTKGWDKPTFPLPSKGDRGSGPPEYFFLSTTYLWKAECKRMLRTRVPPAAMKHNRTGHGVLLRRARPRGQSSPRATLTLKILNLRGRSAHLDVIIYKGVLYTIIDSAA